MTHTGDPTPELIVGVGASAGGLEGFRQLLGEAPTDAGIAFVLTRQGAPELESRLVDELSSSTSMPVSWADSGPLRPNSVSIVRPGQIATVQDATLVLRSPGPRFDLAHTIDHLFFSIAREHRRRGAGIVLSGAGSDGSDGLREIATLGGLALAQSPATAPDPDMPQAAIDTGVVDMVLPIDDMPEALARFIALPGEARVDLPPDREQETPRQRTLMLLEDDDLVEITDALLRRCDFDLSHYKRGTVERRVLRRLVLTGHDRFAPYLELLKSSDLEQRTLARDLMIGVTRFHRDRDAFQSLRTEVVTPLLERLSAGSIVRVWVPGCSTGEEAYSIACELHAAIAAQDRPLSLQVFATDIDHNALERARCGRYAPDIREQLPPDLLETYFEPAAFGYRARSELRDSVSFAKHDLTRDPPFSGLHLVSCRNVLIYLRPETQAHVLRCLHFALEPGGYLFLGASESTGSQDDLFVPRSKQWRIYEKSGTSNPLTVSRAHSRHRSRSSALFAHSKPPSRLPSESSDARFRQAVLDAWAPPSVVVDEAGAVLFLHGDLSPFLTLPMGSPQFELSALLRPHLSARTQATLFRCRRTGESATSDMTLSREKDSDPTPQAVRITATPSPEQGPGTVVVSFEPIAGGADPEPRNAEDERLLRQFESELIATREDLRTTIEELAASNDSLRISNEEAASMNEELQSANEELEATSEELRSANEQLTALNARLRNKVDELQEAHDDLRNFFTSSKLPMLFLDHSLKINRFTPAAASLLDMGADDVGRLCSDFARSLLQHGLADQARAVLSDLSVRSTELGLDDGRWVKRQVLPYRTEDETIRGVVVTFLDITELKDAAQKLEVGEKQQAIVATLGIRALEVDDLDGYFSSVAETAARELNCELCGVYELHPRSGQLALHAGVGWDDGTVGRALLSLEEAGRVGYPTSAPGPIRVFDLSESNRHERPDLFVEHGIVSGLSAVIRHGATTIGVIAVHSRSPRQFSARDADFLQAVANVGASAVAREQSRWQLILERAAADALVEAHGLEQSLHAVLEAMHRLLGAESAQIWLDDGDGTLRLDRSTGGDARAAEGEAPPSVVVEAFRRGQAVTAPLTGAPSDLEAPHGRLRIAGPLGPLPGVLGALVFDLRVPIGCEGGISRGIEAAGRSIASFAFRREADTHERRLAAIMEASHDAIVSYGLDGTVREWLAGAEELFGFSASEMVGSSIDALIPPERREQLESVHQRIAAGEAVEAFETIRTRKLGDPIEVSVHASPVVNWRGEIVGVSTIDRDITRLKQAQRNLEIADRQKDEFLAMLGHELRNPLAVIRSAADVLGGAAADEQQRIHDILIRQSRHMTAVLDGLLDVSRIISGKLRLDFSSVDLAAVVRDCLSDARLRLSDRRLSHDIPDRPVWVWGDPTRLVQLVDNMLSNAIRYSDPGDHVSVSLTVQGDELELAIADSGVGIAPELLPNIFEVFRQAEQSLDRSRGGLGIGLSLVRAIVELHGGTIRAESGGTSAGSRFTVRMPQGDSIAPTASPSREPRPSGSPLTIVVIEDNEDAAELLSHLLEASGHRAHVAHDGRSGLDLVHAREPDVVLCDLGLPGGFTGFDVARTLQEKPPATRPTIFALSGYGRSEDKRRCEAAGFDGHLTKPVDIAALLALLERATQ